MSHNSIVYLAHNDQAHRQAAKFSALSLLRQLDQFDIKPQVIIYTDSPAYFDELGVVVEDLDPCIIDIWKHERTNDDFLKWHVIEDFFKTYHGNMLWVDPYMLWNEDAIELINADDLRENIVYRELGHINQVASAQYNDLLAANNGQQYINPELKVYDTRVLGLGEQFGQMPAKVFDLLGTLLRKTNLQDGSIRQVVASQILSVTGQVTLCNAWFDMTLHKLVNDQIISDFFWLNGELPLAQQIQKSRETEQLILSNPTHYSRNILKMMRELIMA